MNFKKMGRYLRVSLLGPDPRLIKKEFTGPRSHERWETLVRLYTSRLYVIHQKNTQLKAQ